MLTSLQELLHQRGGDSVGSALTIFSVAEAAGYRVPNSYIVHPGFFRNLVSYNHATEPFERLLSSEQSNRFSKIQSLIESFSIPESESALLINVFQELGSRVYVSGLLPNQRIEKPFHLGLYPCDTFTEVVEALKNCYLDMFSIEQYMRGQDMASNGYPIMIQSNPQFKQERFIGYSPEDGGMNSAAYRLHIGEQAGDGLEYCIRIRKEIHETAPNECRGAIVDVDDMNELLSRDLGKHRRKVSKWLGKKLLFRKRFKEAGVAVSPMLFVFLQNGLDVGRMMPELSARIKTRYVDVTDGEQDIRLTLEEIPAYLQSILATSPEAIVLIQAFQMTQISGKLRANGDAIHIETIPGGFYGFIKKNYAPTVYELNSQGVVVESAICEFPEIMAFDHEARVFAPCALLSPEVHRLPSFMISQLHAIAARLTKEFTEIQFDWVFDGHEFELFGVSDECLGLLKI